MMLTLGGCRIGRVWFIDFVLILLASIVYFPACFV